VTVENENVKSAESLLLELSIKESGEVTGKASFTFTGYNALRVRNAFEEVNDSTTTTDIVKNMYFSDFESSVLDSVQVERLDDAYADPILNAYFTINGYTIVSDSAIYFNPLLT